MDIPDVDVRWITSRYEEGADIVCSDIDSHRRIGDRVAKAAPKCEPHEECTC